MHSAVLYERLLQRMQRVLCPQALNRRDLAALYTPDRHSTRRQGLSIHNHLTRATLLQATAELASRYINDRFLPDKAIDILDEVGAAFRLSGTTTKRKNVTVRDVESVVSRMARIPAKRLCGEWA